MEKLIELLNEYDPYIQSDGTHTDNFWWYVSQGHSAVFPKEVGIERIISKHYGFIKRLVDNDKIDIDKYYEFMTNENIDISNACGELDMDKEFYYELLMILAVQDNPIEFLISILKQMSKTITMSAYDAMRLNERIEELEEEIKKLEHNWMLDKRKADRKAIENCELRKENKELKVNYNKALSDVVTLTEENKELKAQIAEYDDLTEELDYRKREAKRLGWNAKDSASTITKIIDGPITYTKDSTGKWVADGNPPIVLC